ncbi:MAG: hypothetical protein ABRQ26_05720 [Syntrophomonadaceae bacterium]
MIKKSGLFMLSILMVLVLASCAKTVDKSEVAGYADPTAERMLLAANGDDYARYMETANDTLKVALPEAKCNETNKLIRDKIGTYVPGSKQIKSAVRATQNGQKYVSVQYTAKYTNEPEEVSVLISFEDNETHKVAGIFLSSPKLRK